MELPAQFIERYQPLAPDGFFAALDIPLSKTLRVNTLKTDAAAFTKRGAANGWELAPLPWYGDAFRIERADRSVPLGHSLEHFAGWCYIQEASSMIPPLVLDAQPGERVLDMAAAPGSKTTQLAAMMHNTGLLVANDSSVARIKALAANQERFGVLNSVITNLSGPRLGRYVEGYFDKVLLDAPCTAEGTMVKNPELVKRWSENAITKLASLQSRLLTGAWQAVKPGGVVVYSTCTFAPEENEGVLDAFLQQHPEAEIEPFELPGLQLADGITEWTEGTYNPRVAAARRVWPGGDHGQVMEGFFIAKIRKPSTAPQPEVEHRHFNDRRYETREEPCGEWLRERFGLAPDWDSDLTWRYKQECWLMTPEAADFDLVPAVRRGLRAARTVRGGYKPTSDWLQLVGAQITSHRATADSERTAAYLRGQDIDLSATGYVALEHDQLVYGCGLGQGAKIKNQLPTSRRLPDRR